MQKVSFWLFHASMFDVKDSDVVEWYIEYSNIYTIPKSLQPPVLYKTQKISFD